MLRKIIFLCLLWASSSATPVHATQYAYSIYFTDKNATIYSLSSPAAYLSARAILRRTAQGIAIDSTDLPVLPQYIDSVLTLTGGEMHEVSRWMNMCVILVTDSNQIHALNGKSYISSIKLVASYMGTLHKDSHRKEPEAAKKQAQRTTSGDAVYYGDTWNQTTMVNGNYLYDLGYSGQGKLISVLDAGFSDVDTHIGFDSLRTSGRLIDEHNFVLATNFVYSYDLHGTEVLSTMAGYVPNTFVGSAPLASYALYVTEDDDGDQPIEMINMLCGAERADSIGSDIITSSLGYNTFDDPADNFVFANLDGKTTIAAKAANIATKKGMLFIASAGNEGGDSWNNILTPGDADSALTIGNVDITEVNDFSSGYGPNAAGQVKPDVCTLGDPANVFSSSGYTSGEGTSFSTPQIAGWAACLWQASPHATPAQLRKAINSSANHYTSPGTQIGYGIPNFGSAAVTLGVQDTQSPQNEGDWIVATPNPFTDNIVLQVTPNNAGIIEFRLTDAAGRVVGTAQNNFKKGDNAPFTITTPASLSKGVYFLKAVSATQHKVIRLVRD